MKKRTWKNRTLTYIMNLLGRIKPLLIPAVIAMAFFSCEQGNGLEVEDDAFNNTSVEFQEFSLHTTNIFIDSLRTDSENAIVTGRFSHPVFGSIEATGYAELNIAGGSIPADTLYYDSLLLKLQLENFRTQDGGNVELYVKSLKKGKYFPNNVLFDDVIYLYTHDLVQDSLVVDTLRFNVTSANQVVSYKANSLGKYIFDRLNLLSTTSEKLKFSDILAIYSAENNLSALTVDLLSDSSRMVMYMHDDSATVYETRLDFKSNHITHITRNTAGTVIENLQTTDTFSVSSDFTYVSPLFGVYSLVGLHPFIDFVQNSGKIIINKAELVSETDVLDVPISSLRYYIHDEQYGIHGEGVYKDAKNYVVLSNESYFNNNTTQLFTNKLDSTVYAGDVTFFTQYAVNQYIENKKITAHNLVVTPNKFVSLQESRLLAPGVKLRIYYTTLK